MRLLIAQEETDGKKVSKEWNDEHFTDFRMNLAEFKQAYNQIKPNYDPYNIYGNDMEAERMLIRFPYSQRSIDYF